MELSNKLTYTKLPLSVAQQRRNCAKLADIIESLRPDQLHMSDFGTRATTAEGRDYIARHNANKRPPCGTVACAVGWAALSHQFKGLQHTVTSSHLQGAFHVTPVVNGRSTAWFTAGETFFGYDVHDQIFTGDYVAYAEDDPEHAQEVIVAGLRHYARTGRVENPYALAKRMF